MEPQSSAPIVHRHALLPARMQPNVLLIVGPPRSGKTAWLLERYRTVPATETGGRLWLSPTYRCAQDVRLLLLQDSSSHAVMAPGICTFASWCKRNVNAGTEPARHLTMTAKRRLLESVVQAARQAGKLAHLERIADQGSFLDLIVEFIAELKSRCISSDQFSAIAQARQSTSSPIARDRNVELARLYAVYQQKLDTHRLLDDAEALWQSVRPLSVAESSDRRSRLELVVADGFSDFTQAEIEALSALARRTKTLMVSLPDDSAGGRADLFAKPRATLSELRERFPELRVERLSASRLHWPAATFLAQHLFRNPREIPPPAPPVLASMEGRLEIIAAAGAQEEIVEIARRIKRRLLETDVTPDEIAVVLRTITDSAPRIREVFTEFGIPFEIEFRSNLAAVPAIRTLLRTLQLQLHDWPFRTLAAVVDDGNLRRLSAAARPAAAWLLRELQIVRGQQALMSQLERVKDWPLKLPGDAGFESPGLDPHRRRILAARQASPLFERLQSALDGLPKLAEPSAWLIAMEKMARQLGLSLSELETNCEHRLAWHQLRQELLSLHTLARWQDQPPPRLSQHEFYHLLSGICSQLRLRLPKQAWGRVRVLSAPTARTIAVRHLFVAGLSEQSFPAAEAAGRLMKEAEYDAVLRHTGQSPGAYDGFKASHTHEEMLLFYEVITRAGESLTLSYPALDASAQQLPPSPFVTEIRRTFGESVHLAAAPPRLNPVAQDGPPYSAREQRIKAVADLASDVDADASAESFARLLATDNPERAVARNISYGLETIQARSCGDTFGEMEGVFAGSEVKNILADRFGPAHLWSPSALETFAACPYRFLLGTVLRLQPLADISLEIDYRQRGSSLHRWLAALHRDARERDVAWSAGELREQLERFLEEQFHRLSASDVQAAMWELDRRQLLQWADDYANQLHDYAQEMAGAERAFTPKYFELRFGPRHRADAQGEEDPHSTDEPLLVDLGDEQIRVSGRIDRIDVGTVAGRDVFNIIDYKTTAPSRLAKTDTETVTAGKQLQLPLYVMAAEKVLEPLGAEAWQAGYWAIRGHGFHPKNTLNVQTVAAEVLTPSSQWQEIRRALQSRLLQFVRAIRRGEFPMSSNDEDCTSHCEFATVCRVAQARSLGKQWSPEEDS